MAQMDGQDSSDEELIALFAKEGRFVSRCNVSIVGTMWISEKAEFCD